jgi:two-component system OmpR family sensor kinase
MTRAPIRLRVAIAFALAMALVLAGTGIFLYERLGADLASSLDQDLRLRALDLAQVVRDPHGSLARESTSRLIEPGESFAQLLTIDGRVLDATRPLARHPLLRRAELVTAGRRNLYVDRDAVPGLDEPARLLAGSVTRAGHRAVLVVGATRENGAEALRSLRTELLIAGPVALLLATTLGYLLAGTGLRAVETMRRRAEAISGDEPGARLPVAQTGDELERLGTTLNDMLARLDDAIERERGFVADAGHELRTPLALLRAELDFALHHAETTEELRAALRVASDETDRLAQLAGDLLLIASAERGAIALRRERLAAAELLESVRNRFAWRASEAGRCLDVRAPVGTALTGDRLRLEQALGNLVDNALRHGAGDILLEARNAGDALELHVRDGGPGFPEGFVEHAFDRFTRADASHGGEGAGLGLAIVEAIACAHGGRALAATRPDGGTDVWITVPAATALNALPRPARTPRGVP